MSLVHNENALFRIIFLFGEEVHNLTLMSCLYNYLQYYEYRIELEEANYVLMP